MKIERVARIVQVCLCVGCFTAVDLCAAEPPVDVIRMESEALLEARIKQQVDPKAIAKEMKLPWPVSKVTKTPKQIQAELAKRSQAPAKTVAAPDIDEAELAERARKKFPVGKSGDVVALTLRSGGSARGKLEVSSGGVIKVGGRSVRHSSLAPESQLMLDPAANLKAREAWIVQERRRLTSVAGTTVVGGNRKLEAELYRGAGYIRWRNQWVGSADLLKKATDYRRKEAMKKLRPAVIQEVAGRYGFKWEGGKWLPLVAAPTVAAVEQPNGTDIAPKPAVAPPVVAVAPPVKTAPPVVPQGINRKTSTNRKKSSVELLFDIDIKAPKGAADPVALPKATPVKSL